MSLNKIIEDMIQELEEENVDEISTTHAGMSYNTPKAFKKKKDDEDDLNESNFMKMAKQSFISEATYKDYKKDDSATSKQKVNRAIREINSRLFAIERIINQNVKLKTEEGVDSSKYWKPTRSNLYKISEKMLRISEKLRKF